jgi:predicted Fe-Mo cluster-binding NifX family protein
MKIAVVTDDSKTISAHFGRAQYYAVFTITDNRVTDRELRPKANHRQFAGEGHGHSHNGEHGTDPAAEQRHNAMIEPISDCQIVIARGMGAGAHRSLLAGKIRPIVTDVENIEEALNAYLSGSLTDHPEKLH